MTSSPLMVGRYAIYDEIAAGGMATVHLGRLRGAAGFARTVAIKRLHPQFAKDPEFVAMFLDEARLAARVRHPNVVATLDVVAKNGELFLVMEYLLGESLSRLWRTVGKAMPLPIVSAILCEALRGLHAAHEATGEDGQRLGLVHRDVSPQNILVGLDGVTRVIDFGVAKALGRVHTTRDGQIKGKLAYMAPEQLRGVGVNVKTDVYAAAVVLWEAITGQRLFQAETEAGIVGKIVEDTVPSARTLNPDVSVELDALVMRGLAKNPDTRFDSAEAMAAALEACERPASSSDVRSWVQRWASASLDARSRRIAEIESASVSGNTGFPSVGPVESPDGGTEATTGPETATMGSVTEVSLVSDRHMPHAATDPRARMRRGARVLGAGSMAAALVLFASSVLRAPTRDASAAAASRSPFPAAVDVPPASAGPVAPEMATDSPVVSAAPAVAPAPHPSRAGRAASSTAPARPTGSGSGRGACYVLDSRGIWHVKPECL